MIVSTDAGVLVYDHLANVGSNDTGCRQDMRLPSYLAGYLMP